MNNFYQRVPVEVFGKVKRVIFYCEQIISLYHYSPVQHVRGFCFFGCFTKNVVVKKKQQGIDALNYSYKLVVINSYSCLHAAVPLLYAPVYSRGYLVCRTKRGGAYHKCIVIGLFVQNFFFEFAFLTLGNKTSFW